MAVEFDGTGFTFAAEPGLAVNLKGSPLTFSMWLYPDSILTTALFYQSWNSGFAANNILLHINAADTNGSLYFRRITSATEKQRRISSQRLTTGSWQHILVTDDGTLTATGAHIYKNNTEASYDVSQDGTGTENEGNGAMLNLQTYDGRVAEYAVWNAALTAGEIAALSNGFAASFIRPQSLVLYQPMIRDVVTVKGTKADATGAVAIAHPRIIYPASPIGIGKATADATTPRPWYYYRNQNALVGTI